MHCIPDCDTVTFLGDPSRLHWFPTDGFGLFYFSMLYQWVLLVNAWVEIERGRSFINGSLLRFVCIMLLRGGKRMTQLDLPIPPPLTPFYMVCCADSWVSLYFPICISVNYMSREFVFKSKFEFKVKLEILRQS